jgi:hypothetical protein
MAEQALAYIKYTFKTTLKYHRESRPLFLKNYVDLDWASSEEHKSTSEMVHLLNDFVIAWSFKKQVTITLSTEEAEYVTVSEWTREVVYLKQLLSEFDYSQRASTCIHENNQTCILFTRDDTTHSYTKHINVKYHFT